MIWFVLLAGVVAVRVILATLRSGTQTSLSRALLFEFGARKPKPGQVLSRRDRLWNALGTLTAAAIAIVAGAGFMTWGDRFPNLSTTNHVLTGIGFVSLMVGAVVALVGLVELIRAPFAPPPPVGAPGKRPLTEDELTVFRLVQELWGDQNTVEDVIFLSESEGGAGAGLFVKDKNGSMPLFVHLANLGAWYRTGVMSYDDLRKEILGPQG